MQDQMATMQRRRDIQDLAKGFVKPDGSFDMPGYQQALAQKDPEAALELQKNTLQQQMMQAQTKLYQAKANEKEAPQTRTIKNGGQEVTQEWDPVAGKFNTIASSSIGAGQGGSATALERNVAFLKSQGYTTAQALEANGVPSATMNQSAIQPGSPNGDAFLQTLPEDQQPLVKAIVDGRYPIPTGRAAASPQWQALVQAAQQVDPTFDAGNYPARAAARKNLTSGKGAQEIKSLNTLAGHISTLNDALDQMGNSNFALGNAGLNAVANQFGGDRAKALARFNTSSKAVGDEAAKVFAGGSSALGDRQEIAHNLDPAAPNDKLRATLQTYAELVQSRLAAVQQQASDSLGAGAASIPIVTPKAQQTFSKLSGQSGPDVPVNPRQQLMSSPRSTNPSDPLGIL